MVAMQSEFSGKTALVTGASRGIGAAAAAALARAGCGRVLVHYSSSPGAAEETARRVREAGADAERIAGDLSTEAGIRSFIEALGGAGARRKHPGEQRGVAHPAREAGRDEL